MESDRPVMSVGSAVLLIVVALAMGAACGLAILATGASM